MAELLCKGLWFRSDEEKAAAFALEPGDPVTLEREPDNEFDPNAIKVLTGDSHIGYIDAGAAALLCSLLEDEDGAEMPSATFIRQVPYNNAVHLLLDVDF